ncbi:MAG: phosphoenolpyruvate--protein phosphotransferase, partial [Thermodesulfobacteriota bacterium]
VEKSKEQLNKIKNKLGPDDNGDHLHILNFNIMMLEDELLSREVTEYIEKEQVNAEWAIRSVLTKHSEALKDVEDLYMRERLEDFYYLGERILRNLHGVKEKFPDLEEDSVLVSHDVSAIDVVEYVKHYAQGIATDIGGSTSHNAIVAKSLGIPTVMGLESITSKASPGDIIFVDGFNGMVIINPDENEVDLLKEKQLKFLIREKKLLDYAKLEGKTTDDHKIKVYANIEIAEELELALSYGAEGIGMYRTEFLFTNSIYFPSEDQQLQSYKKVLSALPTSNVTIRTVDIGGDKIPIGMETYKRLNPALGLRGIRFSLNDIDTFTTQLRAILKAGKDRKIRILIPMVSSLFEVLETKSLISNVAKEIESKCDWELGVMIETPSAAILASDIAKEVDFLSIGTNDLIQYTLAVDRINENVSYLFSSFHPAVLRLIKQVIDSAHDRNIPVCVCGEMAGELVCVPFLVGAGVDELSMNTHSIPKVKKLLNTISKKQAKKIAKDAIKLKTVLEVKDYLITTIIKYWGMHLPEELLEEITADQK